METLLAVVVASAVIFFGALISMGNERQRKAIDDLSEHIRFWAIQDLKMKRGRLEQAVRVEEPVRWLSQIASRITKNDLMLQLVEVRDDPAVLICINPAHNNSILFSPCSPADVRNFRRSKSNRLTNQGERNPLLSISKGRKAYEISMLNGGFLFDVELPLAWKSLTGTNSNFSGRLWMYVFDSLC